LIADGDHAFASDANATSGAFASVPASSALEPASAVTIEAWVRPSQASITSSEDLVAYGNGAAAPYDNYKIELTPPNLASFQVLVDGTSYKISSTQTFAQGQTWHVAGTYNSETGTQALYIDGRIAAWGTIAVNPAGITPKWVACIGDSLTVGSFSSNPPTTGYPQDLSNLLDGGSGVGNFGHGSATVQPTGDVPYVQQPEYTEATTFVSDVPDGGSVDVVVMLGTNDSKPMNWVSDEAFSAAYLSLVQHFQSLHANVDVFLIYPPMAFANPYTIQESVIEEEISGSPKVPVGV
jgi:lysophospholipase L1-like esterase